MLIYVPYKKEVVIIIKINSVNLDALEKIGSGKFGKVYKRDDQTAYKIYHETVTDIGWKEITNPALLLPSIHFSTLIRRSKKLNYSGGILDTIKLDGKFRGVVIPYYDGVEFLKLVDKPIDFKIQLSKKMVRNSKELSKKWIYPMDYRLKNVLLSNGEVELIDLDDSRTHPFVIPSLLFRSISINSLGQTIQSFLKENEHYPFPKEITDNLNRENVSNFFSYKKIDDYLERKEEEKNLIYIDENTDVTQLGNYILDDFEFVYVSDDEHLYRVKAIEIINLLKEQGITLFDIIKRNIQSEYKNIENVDEEYVIDGKELKRIYKKKK